MQLPALRLPRTRPARAARTRGCRRQPAGGTQPRQAPRGDRKAAPAHRSLGLQEQGQCRRPLRTWTWRPLAYRAHSRSECLWLDRGPQMMAADRTPAQQSGRSDSQLTRSGCTIPAASIPVERTERPRRTPPGMHRAPSILRSPQRGGAGLTWLPKLRREAAQRHATCGWIQRPPRWLRAPPGVAPGQFASKPYPRTPGHGRAVPAETSPTRPAPAAAAAPARAAPLREARAPRLRRAWRVFVRIAARARRARPSRRAGRPPRAGLRKWSKHWDGYRLPQEKPPAPPRAGASLPEGLLRPQTGTRLREGRWRQPLGRPSRRARAWPRLRRKRAQEKPPSCHLKGASHQAEPPSRRRRPEPAPQARRAPAVPPLPSSTGRSESRASGQRGALRPASPKHRLLLPACET